MVFRRRNPLTLGERLRLALWPAGGWKRSARYVSRRVLRLSGSPHAIAAGFAAGVFASFTPFIGFHLLISFVIAFLIGGNMLAAALGTAVGNPITFPLIWLSDYKVGGFLLGQTHGDISAHELSDSVMEHSMSGMLPVLQQLTVGSIPLGIGFGLVAYLMVWWTVSIYQQTRRQRLAAARGTPQRTQRP